MKGCSAGWRLVALAAVLAIAVTACSSGDGPSSNEDTTTTAAVSAGDELGPGQDDAPARYDGPQVDAEANLVGLKWSWDMLDTVVEDVSSVAGGASFFEFEWCEVEPSPGTQDWTEVDDVVESTKRLGYTPMLKIRVGSCWVNGTTDTEVRGTENKKTASKMPLDLAQYAAFVDAVVRRYVPMGVTSYAIENEVNASNFWDGTPDEYSKLLTRGAQAVHAADPAARVLDGGISSIGYGVAICAQLVAAGKPQEALAFYRSYYERRFARDQFIFKPVSNIAELQAVLDSRPAKRAVSFLAATFNTAGAVDAYQLHYYEQPRDLDAVLGHISAGVAKTHPGIPIEAWEVGLAWPGDTYDPNVAASETAQQFGIGFASGMRLMLYLPAAYRPGGLREEEIWRGLWEPDGSPRPAAGTFAELAEATSGDAVELVPVNGPSVRGVVFGRGASSTLLAWAPRGGQVPLELPPGSPVEVLDAAGTQQSTSGTPMIGAEPIFVVAEVPTNVLAAAATR